MRQNRHQLAGRRTRSAGVDIQANRKLDAALFEPESVLETAEALMR
jgi:hypothetical protein